MDLVPTQLSRLKEFWLQSASLGPSAADMNAESLLSTPFTFLEDQVSSLPARTGLSLHLLSLEILMLFIALGAYPLCQHRVHCEQPCHPHHDIKAMAYCCSVYCHAVQAEEDAEFLDQDANNAASGGDDATAASEAARMLPAESIMVADNTVELPMLSNPTSLLPASSNHGDADTNITAAEIGLPKMASPDMTVQKVCKPFVSSWHYGPQMRSVTLACCVV